MLGQQSIQVLIWTNKLSVLSSHLAVLREPWSDKALFTPRLQDYRWHMERKVDTRGIVEEEIFDWTELTVNWILMDVHLR